MQVDQLTLGAVALLLAKELISFFKSSQSSNATALQENTLALTRLQVEIAHLQEAMKQLPKLRSDIDEAHGQLRELSAHLKGVENA